VLVELGKNIATLKTDWRRMKYEPQIEEAEETAIKAGSVASSLEYLISEKYLDSVGWR